MVMAADYLIVEHDGMRKPRMKQARPQRREFDDYVRDTVGGGSAVGESAGVGAGGQSR